MKNYWRRNGVMDGTMFEKVLMNNPQDGFPVEFVNAARVLGRYDATHAQAAEIARIIPVETHRKVLDVCCGFGRMTGLMHHLGYDISGIDLSADQIELARLTNPGPAYRIGDMRELPADGSYDAIINMFTSFGYFAEEQHDVDMLSNWAATLRTGGILIMELADMDRARAKLDRQTPVIVRRTGDLVEECVMDWAQRIFKVTYVQGQSKFTCYTRLYEKEALRDHLLNAGFSTVKLYGGLDLHEKTGDDNLVVVATK